MPALQHNSTIAAAAVDIPLKILYAQSMNATDRIILRVTPDEKMAAVKVAKRKRLSLSALVRELLLSESGAMSA